VKKETEGKLGLRRGKRKKGKGGNEKEKKNGRRRAARPPIYISGYATSD